MALKDIATDLSKFKYGLSSPDKLDNQIENGVDFFDNNEGGADGFTPKTDLESLYHKVRDGNIIAAPNPPGNTPQFTDDFMTTPIADYYSSFNPPENDSLTFSVNQHISTGPTQFQITNFDDTPFIPNAHKISNDSGKWGGYDLPELNSSAGQSKMMIINDKRRGVFDHLPELFFEHKEFPLSQDANSVFAPSYSRFFNEISSKTIMRMVEQEVLPGVVVEVPEYETVVGASSIHISPGGELKTGLRYGIESNGQFASLGSGITITDTMGTKWPENAPAKTITDRYSTLNYPYPISEGSRLHDWGDSFLEKWPDAATSHDKERGGYDQYAHLRRPGFFEGPLNFPLDEDGLYNEVTNAGASVHVSKLDTDIKAGYLYGYRGKKFTQTEDGLEDTFLPPGSQYYSGPANLYRVGTPTMNSPVASRRIFKISSRLGLARPLTQAELNQISELEQQLALTEQELGNAQANQDDFSGAQADWDAVNQANDRVDEVKRQIREIQNREMGNGFDFFGGSQMFSIAAIQSNATARSNFNEGYNGSDYTSELNVGPFLWGQEYKQENALTLVELIGGGQRELFGQKLYRRKSLFDSTAVPWLRKSADNDQAIYGMNNKEVPAGLDELNKFSTDDYKKVANRGPFEGKNNHPLILRDMGNNWGFDNIPLDDNPISDAISGMVRGAPGITGLISRNVTDKLRLGKWLFFTSEGLGFNLKQFGLQALNPTLESKVYNPLSVLGMAGAGDAATAAFDAFKDAFSAVRGDPRKFPNLKEFANTVKSGISGDFLASLLLPIGHPERHLGGLKYEDVNPLTAISDESDLGKKIKSIPIIGGKVFDEINKKIGDLGGFSRLQAIAQDIDMGGDMFELTGGDFGEPDGITRMTLINPNRYLFPISSAPVMIERGVPSFTSGPDVAKRDGLKIKNKKGFGPKGKPGTFNLNVDTDAAGVKTYIQLNKGNAYTNTASNREIKFFTKKVETRDGAPAGSQLIDLIPREEPTRVGIAPEKLSSASPFKDASAGNIPGDTPSQTENQESPPTQVPNAPILKRHVSLLYENLIENSQYLKSDSIQSPMESQLLQKGIIGTISKKRLEEKKIVDKIGKSITTDVNTVKIDDALGKVKTDASSGQLAKGSNVDVVNMTPVITHTNDTIPDAGKNDFIKFMFKDVVNSKYLIFRAILDGITDTVSPEYNETKFIGRPDKLYTYTGTDRSVSFGFKIYPKTKQELPILMEKLNYLIGMCYPTFTEGERMITPFMELTLGDMFVRTPGLLASLTATVEETGTWEIDEGFQFPHFISCQCEFKYIGKRENAPTAHSKHYDLSWVKFNQTKKTKPTFKVNAENKEVVDRSEATTTLGTIGLSATHVQPLE